MLALDSLLASSCHLEAIPRGLVLGCIEAKFCNKICVGQLFPTRILQVNTRWKALAEIYTMHPFAPFSILKILFKNR